MELKMLKLKDDTCYGKKYGQIEQCSRCWIKTPCLAVFKNLKS